MAKPFPNPQMENFFNPRISVTIQVYPNGKQGEGGYRFGPWTFFWPSKITIPWRQKCLPCPRFHEHMLFRS